MKAPQKSLKKWGKEKWGTKQGKQFVSQPKKIAKKTAKYRK